MKIPGGNCNLTQFVANKLGQEIVEGKYQPGQTFPTEAQLSQQFSISRSVMREAVKMLTAKGLITSRPRQGIKLMPVEKWNVFDADVLGWITESRTSIELLREFSELRCAVETEAVALAASRKDPKAMEKIDFALAQVRAAENDSQNMLEANIQFHCSLLLACQNRFYVQLTHFVDTALRLEAKLSPQLSSFGKSNFEYYKDVANLIRVGDSDSASYAIRRCIEAGYEKVERSLDLEQSLSSA